ncbi:Nramp family divalent metal transporter [Clostridium estertheticum]|uniref:Nramp family divalent metal transporter n=1 Tax=Clostridium estertheticum TaxID=238834 RepID=UPI001CF1765D|nr:Nramp family divalent metal transporter [Clostridium estertheticum]MCB2309413.1 Nramp family divalent metal transporter [Clostridium estertheticum]MCB2347853.1 Nramp family divalent metal transporter [Clostridium estertheticum]MCB2352373.1 Nramp family divalent metal transporter [Clostridium estertheticum]WAG46942.1 Nramp family divalent metal transporter [Clostridium estertheticum]
MNLSSIKNRLKKKHEPNLKALNFIRYIGPGLLVTVGFIDPGNWASNISAGGEYGYALLWMVTLSTIMLIILQHNAAHLGIVTGDCLSEASTATLNPRLNRMVLGSAVIAAVSTALAELLGGAIALNMLFGIPLKLGTILVLCFILWILYTNSYKKLEKWIIGFVSLIGISFLFELSLVHVEWGKAVLGWIKPSFPSGSLPIIMSVLGAVVMPHNLFLHSQVIQSRQWNLEDESIIKKQLKYEFMDTFFSMIVGWAINSAMILIAATTFFAQKVQVTELSQAQQMLTPLLGNTASIVFATALLFAGISSSVTAGMAGGSIFAGIFGKDYDINNVYTKLGIGITLIGATIAIFFITNPFKGLIYSQMLLSIQLPITIFLQIYLTSSKKVMGKYANSTLSKITLWIIGLIVTGLNIMLLLSLIA